MRGLPFSKRPPAVPQLAHNQRGTRLLWALIGDSRTPGPQLEFYTSHRLDTGLAQRSGDYPHRPSRHDRSRLLRRQAARHSKAEVPPQSTSTTRSLFVVQLLRRRPRRRSGQIIRQVVHQEFNLLQQLGYELAILTPTEWIEIWQRHSRHRSRCLSTRSCPCRLFPFSSHFRI